MTILFSGNDYKYEVEAIMKLFFPAENFSFAYEETNSDGDFCCIRLKKCKTTSYLYVFARLNDRTKRLASKVSLDAKDYNHECELGLCKLLFLCMKELTGIHPSWGVLTGIRPVKRVHRMIDEGFSKEEIYSSFSNRFLVSNEKIDLAWKTAEVQKPFLIENNEKKFSLYVSIPFCPTRCSYCSFVSHSMDSAIKLMPEYLECICEELALTAEIARNLGLTLDTVYFGGGTPTSLEAAQLDRLMKCIQKNFDLSHLREYNVEAGRADTITSEKLKVIKDNGATRICINPQTLNDDVLNAIGRKHSASDVISAYSLARKVGLNCINMDLIAGLPTDTVESFISTINKVTELAPENITVHTLSLKRSASLYQDNQGVMQNPVGQMVSYSFNKLGENGYSPYYLYRQKNTIENLENIGYSKTGFESLYNIYIMEETQTILAVGAAASTKIVTKGHQQRIYNYKFPYEYIRKFDEMKRRKNQIYDCFE